MTDVLLALLRSRANRRGLVLATEVVLLEGLRTESAALRAALAKLESTGAILVLAPLPFLVVKLKKWSGKKSDHAESAAKTAVPLSRAYSFQSSLSQSTQSNESYRHQSDAEEALLREILETLGETDPVTFRGALRKYSPQAIRTALERVRRTPSIRRNRTALFRYLLPRLAKEQPPTN